MTWISHPCREYKKKTICLLTFLILIFSGIYFSFGGFWFFIALILVGGAILPYFLPTTYTLNDEQIQIKGLITNKKKKWGEFNSFYPDKNGILLSPFKEPSRLENFRGLYIRFNNNKGEVTEYISKKIYAS